MRLELLVAKIPYMHRVIACFLMALNINFHHSRYYYYLASDFLLCDSIILNNELLPVTVFFFFFMNVYHQLK